jgi:ubiquinone/menaquinone biosynthesis C-methylase UbiE
LISGGFGHISDEEGTIVAERACPWWVGYLLTCPVRRFAHNPRAIFGPYVKPGMTVLELGPGMGFFTLDLARLVGAQGHVVSVDVQQRMLSAIERRAGKAGLLQRIEVRLGGQDDQWAHGLDGTVDVALAIYVLHEVEDLPGFLAAIRRTLAPGGALFISEPKGHVSKQAYAQTLAAARGAGFKAVGYPKMRQSRAVLMVKE